MMVVTVITGRDAAYKAERDRSRLVDQDRSVGSWMRRYKPEDHEDIVRLMTNCPQGE